MKAKLERILRSSGQAASWLARVWEGNLQLRTKLLLSFVLLTVALTFGTLLVVRHAAMSQEHERIEESASNAILTFKVVQEQVQQSLTHKAEVLAWVAFTHDGDAEAVREASEDPWTTATTPRRPSSERSSGPGWRPTPRRTGRT